MERGEWRDCSDLPTKERRPSWLLKAECECGCAFRITWKWCGAQLRCPVPRCEGQVTLQLQRQK